MHKRHPVLAFGAIHSFMLTSVQVYAGGPLLLSRAWRAVSLAERRPADPVQSRSGRPRSADQRAGGRAVHGGVRGLGRRRLGDRDARQRRAAAG